MRETNYLSVVLQPFVADWGTEITVVPVIDQLLLTRRVAVFEQNEHMQPAGAYAGICSNDFDFGPLDEYLMWNLNDSTPKERYLLGCNCSIAGCWPFVGTISKKDDFVIWDHFRQPFRKEWDYSSFGPFIFEAEPYMKAVEAIRTLIRQLDKNK